MIFSGLLGPGAQQVVLNFGLGATDVAASARDHVLHWVTGQKSDPPPPPTVSCLKSLTVTSLIGVGP